MKQSRRLATILFAFAALAGCKTFEAPSIESAHVITYSRGSRSKPSAPEARFDLTRARAAELSSWLLAHRESWHPIIATYQPRMVVNATDNQGGRWSLIVTQNKLFVAGSFRHLARGISDSEYLALEKILDPVPEYIAVHVEYKLAIFHARVIAFLMAFGAAMLVSIYWISLRDDKVKKDGGTLGV
jgi:hypothetical protein